MHENIHFHMKENTKSVVKMSHSRGQQFYLYICTFAVILRVE